MMREFDTSERFMNQCHNGTVCCCPTMAARPPAARPFWMQQHSASQSYRRAILRTRCGSIVDEAVRAKNRNKSKIHSYVEHVFGLVKRLWGLGNVRYRGLQKNATRALTASALANLYLVRQNLMAQGASMNAQTGLQIPPNSPSRTQKTLGLPRMA